MKKILFLLALAVSVSATAQNKKLLKQLEKAQGVEITYFSSYHGQVYPGRTLVTVSGQTEKIGRVIEQTAEARPERFPKQTTYVDFGANTWYNYAELKDGSVVSSAREFEYGKNLTEIGDTTLLGLPCKRLRTSINSNTIEIWYTKLAGFRATPQPGVGIPDGVVLYVSRNGQSVQQADKITPVKTATTLLPTTWGEQVEGYEYTYRMNNADVITVPVFTNESVRFTGEKLPAELKADEVYNVAGGSIIMKKVNLPDAKGRDVFVELTQYSLGDAYDRTGSVFVIPTDKKLSFLDMLKDLKSVPGFDAKNGVHYPGLVSTPEYTVPMELMRFFTSFGVRQFNYNKVPGQEWADKVLYKTNVTELASALQGEVWICAYIGNWDAKGHNITMNLKYYPEGEREFNHVMPLFNTVNYMEQQGQEYPVFMRDDVLTTKFTLTEDAKDARLFYITTGHGGWGGGDEFNPKVNTILLDGQKVISFIPWKDDCGTYRNWNPCSGNFSNGLSSSDLSRSNWCPGTVTNPEYIWLGDIPAGEHTITVQIPQGAPEGGSNSYWCLSGTLLY